MAMKSYNRGPCPVCGRSISNAGFAEKAHEAAHVRRGEMVQVNRYTWQGKPIPGDSEYVAPRDVARAAERNLFPTFEACRAHHAAARGA